jgi:NADH:ubiquinone oxidoreductase subunit F (NADH-binding)/ferredoxin
MALAGYAVGADEGIVYIRAEYPLAVKRLKKAINDAKEFGFLGEDIFGTDFKFNIDIRLGAGAFVCGEETALIHSIEGYRGEPTTKPPFPANSGLWGKPTLINNVETFANVPLITLKGAEWFRKIGTEKSPGTKVFALAGAINNVGLVEVPMGTTLRDIVFEIGGGIRDNKAFKAVQTGGPSGGCIPSEYLDTPIDFDNLSALGSMMGSGGMIVMDENSCMVDVSKFYLEFTVEESCGKCTPCRIGNVRLLEILERITSGRGTRKDLKALEDLGAVIKDSSLCGLGQTAPNPILSTYHYFKDEYIAHVDDKTCPAGACKSLVKYVIDEEKCVGCTACARVCPVEAIEGEIKKTHEIDQDKCIKCGACYQTCRFGAISKI